MLIRVQYGDRSYGFVDDTSLENLISADEIIGFQRTEGWVEIGSHPVRAPSVERRRSGTLLNIYV